MTTLDGIWQSFSSWYAGAQYAGEGPREALVAIASVAAVAWTGGFIIRGFPGNRATLDFVDAMDRLQYAFVGPIVGLLATPSVLRSILPRVRALLLVLHRYCSTRYPTN